MRALFGRSAELERIEALAPSARVLLLVGPPGVGKTRLASEVMRRLDRPSLFIDASSARTSDDLVHAIARALGVRGSSDLETTARTFEVLEEQKLVLVLDELEHLTRDVAEMLPMLVDACPSVLVLCTSRERLSIGEAAFEVPPLDVDSASKMFASLLDRAGRSSDPATARDIVSALDNLPLAIELAASRAIALGAREVRDEIRRESLAFDAMRRALDGSYARLSETHRAAFAACSIFRGSFDVLAADAVLPGARDALQALVDASLVLSRSNETGTRFHMLTVVRTYAREKLAHDSDARVRHALHFAEIARSRTDDVTTWKRLALDRENLEDAWEHARVHDHRAAVEIALALERVLVTQGPPSAYEAVLAQALEIAEDDRAKSALLIAEGRRLALRGHHLRAVEHFERARLLAKDDDALFGSACSLAAFSWRPLGNFAKAAERGREARDVGARLKDPRLSGVAETMLGLVATAEMDFARAKEHHERAIALASSPRSPRLLGIALGNFVYTLLRSGTTTGAQAALEEAFVAFEDAGDRLHVARVTPLRASVLRREGKIDEAARLLSEMTPVLQSLGDLEAEAEVCIELARIAKERGDIATAHRRLREAEAIAARTDEHLLQDEVRAERAGLSPQPKRTLVIDEDACTIEIDGVKIDLSRRASIRRIVVALARAKESLSTDDLIAAGWPGERMRRESGTARVYMTVRRLRALGLGDLLQTRDAGYRIDPDVAIRIVSRS